jgi:serine/threonine-protein kinase
VGPSSDDASLPRVCPACRTRYPADALFCAFDGAPLAVSPAAIAAAAATDPYLGHEIAGAIEIRQLVGIGGMGRVYRGFQKGIDRDVAVKILHRELSANQTVVARFQREAKVASRLDHPNVVHVLLSGQLADGAMYIVMEYLDGLSLQSALAASGGCMPLARALHVALGVCEAAGEAHAQGIVHRDLKPENVMLVRRPDDADFVKVLDFGIARLNWGDQSMATAAGLIFGTARYISPEAAQGEKVGPAGDVYSIATMLYQMLAGRTPFDAGQAVALLVHQIHDPPPALKSVARASYVPDPIAAAVMRNLAKRPGDRAENARELGRTLLEAATASGLSAAEILARPRPSRNGRPSHAGTTAYDPPPAASHGSRSVVKTEIAELQSDSDGRSVVRSPSAVDATMNELEQPARGSAAPASRPQLPPVDRRPSRTVVHEPSDKADKRRALPIAVAFILVVAVAAAGFAAKSDLLSLRHERSSSLESLVSRANDALLHQRWDSPKGDNVRDLTDEGLARWPHDPQLLRLRALGCGDIIKTARAKRDEGSLGEALRLAKLAYQLDPSDDVAQKLAAKLESEAQSPPMDGVPPLANARAPVGTTASVVTTAHVTMDSSNAKPNVGEAVDFAARVLGPDAGGGAKVEGAAFHVSGPGLAAGAQLDAANDGSGAFHRARSAARASLAFGPTAHGRGARSGYHRVAQRPHLPGVSGRKNPIRSRRQRGRDRTDWPSSHLPRNARMGHRRGRALRSESDDRPKLRRAGQSEAIPFAKLPASRRGGALRPGALALVRGLVRTDRRTRDHRRPIHYRLRAAGAGDLRQQHDECEHGGIRRRCASGRHLPHHRSVGARAYAAWGSVGLAGPTVVSGLSWQEDIVRLDRRLRDALGERSGVRSGSHHRLSDSALV